MESWMDCLAGVFICYWKSVIVAWCHVPTRCMGLIARKACKIISAYLMAWDGLGDCLSFCMASFHIYKRLLNYFYSFEVSLLDFLVLYYDICLPPISNYCFVEDFPVHVADRQKYDLQLIKLAHDVFSLRQIQELIAVPPRSCVWRQVLSFSVILSGLRDPAPPHCGLPVPAHYHFYLPTIPKPRSRPRENGENRIF